MHELLEQSRVRVGTPLLVAALVSFVLLAGLALLAPILLADSAAAIRPDQSLRPAGLAHPLGTDELGRDVLERVLVAARLSLGISLAATLMGASAGILVGSLPTILGGLPARIVSASINLALAFPALLLALFVAAVLGAGTTSSILAIALAMAPVFARLTYTLAAGVSEADHIAAARLLGVGSLRILVRHVIPIIGGPLLVTAVIGLSSALLVLSGLSFLGLGVQPPHYDWGTLLSQGLNRIYVSPASSIAPAAAIVLTGLMLALIGEALALWTGVRERRAAAISPPETWQSENRSGASGRLLAVEGLTIAFGDTRVVRDLSFSIAPSERVGIVGESGSGKTLTAFAAAGLGIPGAAVRADRIEFLGRRLDRASGDEELRHFLGRHMAFVFQDPLGSFNPMLRVGDQLSEVAREHLGATRASAQTRVVDRLGAVSLPDPERRAADYPHQFSGGMLQRGMIAMGLMANPRLLIADEPTTALDVTVQKRVLDLLDQVCDDTGTALLLISHDLAVVVQRCERILVMYAGRIVEELSADDLVAGAAHPYTRALRDSAIDLGTDRSRPLPAIAGDPATAGSAPPGCAFAPRCSRATALCGMTAPDLSEARPGRRVACWNPYPAVAPMEAA